MKRIIPFTTALGLLLAAAAQASPPAQLPHQGRILVNNQNFDGTGEFKFALVELAGNQQAAARAVVNTGFVSSIDVIRPGSGYLSPPRVIITDATGSGALAVAVVANGEVSAINITNNGFGYSGRTIVTIGPPDAPDAASLWSNNGSSVNGSEPTAAVRLAVTNGLYAVGLGDQRVLQMTEPIPGAIFGSADNIHLRTWFSATPGGPFEQLSPDQRLLTSPFAFHSETATSSGFADLASQATLADTANTLSPEAVLETLTVTGTLQAGELVGTLPDNSVGTSNIQNDSLTADDLATNSVTSDELASNSVGLSELSLDFLRADANDTFTGNTLTIDQFSTLRLRDGADIEFNDGGGGLITWLSGQSRLKLFGDLQLDGVLQTTPGIAASTSYHRFGGGTASQQSIDSDLDLFVTDGLEVNGDIYADSDLFVGTDSASDIDRITFDSVATPESLSWNDGAGQFEFSDDVSISDGLRIGGNLSTEGILFFKNGFILYDDATTHFATSTGLSLNGALRAGSNNLAPAAYHYFGDGNVPPANASITSVDDVFVEDDLKANGDIYALSINPSSDREAKKEFAPVDETEILEKVTALPLTTWVFKSDGEAVRHIGPMAQDFHAAFGLGGSDRHIATVDADGVALAAIQGLKKLVDQQAAALAERDRQIKDLEARLTVLEGAQR